MRAARKSAKPAFELNFGTVEPALEGDLITAFQAEPDSDICDIKEIKKAVVETSDLSIDERIKEALSTFWGFSEFRAGQFDIIKNIVEGKDVIGIMPTGHGKSLAYQLPPLVMGKPALVISPLIALMEEQVQVLQQRGIGAAYSGQGGAGATEWEELSVLFMSPESAEKQFGRISTTDFCMVAVDEAHCVSEWGAGFRKSYRTLGVLRSILPPEVPILAITATATQSVVDDIADTLSLKSPVLLTQSFDRQNLTYSVNPLAMNTVEEIIKIVNDESCSIIYCSSIKDSERLCRLLQQAGLSVGLYHAGLSPSVRFENQRRFMSGDVKTVVCTIAFGMGIDKPDVRHVIHYGPCKSINEYYQQTGRAGRDGKPAHCTMFVTASNIMSHVSRYTANVTPSFKQLFLNEISEMIHYIETPETVCRRVPLLSHFGEEYKSDPKNGCGACDHCLSKKTFEKVNITRQASDMLQLLSGQKYRSCLNVIHAIYLGTDDNMWNTNNPMLGQARRSRSAMWSKNPEFDLRKTKAYIHEVLKALRKLDLAESKIFDTWRPQETWDITPFGKSMIRSLKRGSILTVSADTKLSDFINGEKVF